MHVCLPKATAALGATIGLRYHRQVSNIATAIGLDPTVVTVYALRHSSIVRGLRNRLPIQHVAKLHNTSVKMIERHYAKYISTALEDLARAAVVPLVPRHVETVIG